MVTNQAPVLSIHDISKSFGSNKILNGISVNVYPGEIFGFLGPNGSGKTTTIKMMLGLLEIDSGSISICGHDVTKDFEAAISNIGGIIENPEMYKYLTGRENLEVFARMYGDISEERFNEVIKMVNLETRIDDKVSKYSLGMRQRLGVAQAILHSPKLLVLDEPTNGLDPAGIKDLREILGRLAHEQGFAVFISSHQLAELDLMCDRIGIIDKGVLLDTLTIDEVRNAGEGNSTMLSIEVEQGTDANIPEDIKDRFTKDDKGVLHCAVEHAEIPDLIKTLCDSGVRIYGASSVKHSIEDVFLALTSDGEVGTGGFEKSEVKEGGDVQ